MAAVDIRTLDLILEIESVQQYLQSLIKTGLVCLENAIKNISEDDIRQELNDRNYVQTIKRVRRVFGYNLSDAKQLVDSWRNDDAS